MPTVKRPKSAPAPGPQSIARASVRFELIDSATIPTTHPPAVPITMPVVPTTPRSTTSLLEAIPVVPRSLLPKPRMSSRFGAVSVFPSLWPFHGTVSYRAPLLTSSAIMGSTACAFSMHSRRSGTVSPPASTAYRYSSRSQRTAPAMQ